MKTAYILSALRTPGGKANKGAFRAMRPDDLAATAIKALVERTGVDPERIEDVSLGCSFPEGEQGMNVARIAALKAGLPVSVAAQTVNRFCSSGLQTIAGAAERIMVGAADCIVAGGVESMSLIPMGGNKYSPNPSLETKWPEVYASMGITAEILAERFAIGRTEQDEFACASHRKAAAAVKEGRFAGEIVAVEVEETTLAGGEVQRRKRLVDVDEGVRPESTVDSLAKLKPAFKENGTVTAGNASQMTDGAAVAMVVSEDLLKELGRDPIARFVAFAVRGVAPEIMGIGPVEAVPAVLRQAGLEQDRIGLIELNEAFAVQSLAVIRQLDLDPQKVNVNGGAIALGHPLGCTGAKLTATLLAEMQRTATRYGLVTMCVGGGMGAAGIFERL